jgi:cell wall-associated NlpC family hydrolase
MADAPIIPVSMLIIGGYFAWFGVHYWRTDVKWPSDPVKSALTGKPIPGQTGKEPSPTAVLTADVQALQPDSSSGSTSSGGTPTATTGSAISDDALKYVGKGYVWGGNASSPGDWDCSSFVSYVLGHDLNQALPGGHWGDPGFPPHAHGPTTINYLVFGSPVDTPAAGDLIVWQTHVGICTGGNSMVSALDPQLGTRQTTIDGGSPGGETPHYRRVSSG